MLKRSLSILLTAAAGLVVIPIAAAKGPDHATISGPGLQQISIDGFGEGGPSSPLGTLVQEAGFFPATFGQSPNPMLAGRPAGGLGPRYTVRYRVPGPSNTSTIRQDLYPYAAGGPVSYTPAGQPFFDAERTAGGWFRGTATLKAMLVKAGLPAKAPSRSADGHTTRIAAAAAFGAGLVGLAALVLRRRRPH